jgi:hypothetical protein
LCIQWREQQNPCCKVRGEARGGKKRGGGKKRWGKKEVGEKEVGEKEVGGKRGGGKGGKKEKCWQTVPHIPLPAVHAHRVLHNVLKPRKPSDISTLFCIK